MSVQSKLSTLKPQRSTNSLILLMAVFILSGLGRSELELTTSLPHVFSPWQHFSRAVSPTKTLNQVCPKVNAILKSAFHPTLHPFCTSRPRAAAEKPGKGMWSIANLRGWRQRQRRQLNISLAYIATLGTKLYSPGRESMYFMKITASTRSALCFSFSPHACA